MQLQGPAGSCPLPSEPALPLLSPSIQAIWPWCSTPGAFREECRSAESFLCISLPFESQASFMFLSVQPPHSKGWAVRVSKRPSTVLRECASPLTVHQRRLGLIVLQGWTGMCWGDCTEDWGSFFFFPPSHVQLERSICVTLTSGPLWPLGDLVSRG